MEILPLRDTMAPFPVQPSAFTVAVKAALCSAALRAPSSDPATCTSLAVIATSSRALMRPLMTTDPSGEMGVSPRKTRPTSASLTTPPEIIWSRTSLVGVAIMSEPTFTTPEAPTIIP